MAEHHLLAADGAEPHAWKELVGLDAVPASEGRAQAGTSNRIPPFETEVTESSPSKMTTLPSRLGIGFEPDAIDRMLREAQRYRDIAMV